ncbi:MAG: hypothetical protein Q8P52_02330 [bacterium]|nr:hypothetical protein [bacterium]
MEPKSSNKIKAQVAGSFTFFLLSLVLYVGVFFFTIFSAGSASTLMKKAAEKERQEKQAVDLKETMREASVFVETVSATIIGDDIVTFLSLLENIGDTTGADIEIESLDQAGAGGSSAGIFIDKLSVRLSLKGSWDEVFRSLAAIEAAPYSVAVEQAQVEKNKEEDLWRAELTFSVLKYK